HEGKHAAMLRRAGEIGVAQRVARAVDARALAVPHAEHAVEAPFAAQLRLLRTPQRGCGQILVNGGLEENVVRLAQGVGALELGVEPAQRRAAIARDIARRSGPGAAGPRLLHQAHAHQRLVAGDEDASLRQVVFVVEGDAPERRIVGRRGFLRRVLEHHGLVLPTVSAARPNAIARAKYIEVAQISKRARPWPCRRQFRRGMPTRNEISRRLGTAKFGAMQQKIHPTLHGPVPESTSRSYGIGTCSRFACLAHILIGEPVPTLPEYALAM